MTKGAVQGGKYLGHDADGIAQTEADHFMECTSCGKWFDMRDLGEVFEHCHNADLRTGALTQRKEPRRPEG
jgi:hypothetical protein